MKKVLIYLLWLIGAIAFIYFGHKGGSKISNWARERDLIELAMLVNVLFAAISGALLVLIGGAKRRKPTNWKLFYVISIPSFLIALLPLMMMHIPINWSFLHPIYRNEYVYYFGVVAGYTYCKSLFRSQDS